MTDQPRPAFTDLIANLRAASSPAAALRGLAAHSWTKLRTRRNCYGDYGAPGC